MWFLKEDELIKAGSEKYQNKESPFASSHRTVRFGERAQSKQKRRSIYQKRWQILEMVGIFGKMNQSRLHCLVVNCSTLMEMTYMSQNVLIIFGILAHTFASISLESREFAIKTTFTRNN